MKIKVLYEPDLDNDNLRMFFYILLKGETFTFRQFYYFPTAARELRLERSEIQILKNIVERMGEMI